MDIDNMYGGMIRAGEYAPCAESLVLTASHKAKEQTHGYPDRLIAAIYGPPMNTSYDEPSEWALKHL